MPDARDDLIAAVLDMDDDWTWWVEVIRSGVRCIICDSGTEDNPSDVVHREGCDVGRVLAAIEAVRRG